MSDLPSVEAKIQVEATRFRSAVSEFLIQGIGSSINFLIDDSASQDARITALEGKVPNVVLGAAGSSTAITVAITVAASNKVLINIQPITTSGTADVDDSAVWRLKRNAAVIAAWGAAGSGGGNNMAFPFYDVPGAGTFTYTFEKVSGPVPAIITGMRLTAQEIIL